ncbi:MAG: 50S ribosomal protein L11 methyltransferase [Chloroflexi bacterium]|nr:50S ribosomal protein L11 methyltransferase [Chloroflexota bacterium]
MKWIEVSVEVDGEGAEAVAEVFQKIGHGGVAIEGDIQPSLDGAEYPVTNPGHVTVKAYLPQDQEVEEKKRQIVTVLALLGTVWPLPAPAFHEVDEQDWANAWKEHFQVLRIGRRLVVKPTWRPYGPLPDDVVIELDPGMAFGTGLHPSTRLCLMEMEDTPLKGRHVLDVGTGSGILAIAAAKLGARRVLALDIDPVAVEVATANALLNQVSGRVTAARGTLPLDGDRLPSLPRVFDVTVANITAPVLTDMAPHLMNTLGPGGRLIAGGIISEALARGLAERLESLGGRVLKVAEESDWRTLVVQRVGM